MRQHLTFFASGTSPINKIFMGEIHFLLNVCTFYLLLSLPNLSHFGRKRVKEDRKEQIGWRQSFSKEVKLFVTG
jgi:hypothetical protein